MHQCPEGRVQAAKAKVDKHLSYSRIIAPKGGINGIKAYLASSYYKKRNLPRSARKKILDAAAANEELCRLEGIKANLKDKLALEEPIDLRDFRFDLHRYSPSFDHLGIVILGNHEYVGFPDVDAAVAFYKESLEPLGYAVLQNECIEDDRCVIYGGHGLRGAQRALQRDEPRVLRRDDGRPRALRDGRAGPPRR